MISFKKMTLWEKLAFRLFPARRRKYEKEMKEAIDYLMAHPERPALLREKLFRMGSATLINQNEPLLW
jgi:hypothetical protein